MISNPLKSATIRIRYSATEWQKYLLKRLFWLSLGQIIFEGLQNRVLREIIVPEWEEEIWVRWKRHIDEIRYLYWLPNIIQVINPGRWYARRTWIEWSIKEVLTKFWERSERQKENFKYLCIRQKKLTIINLKWNVKLSWTWNGCDLPVEPHVN